MAKYTIELRTIVEGGINIFDFPYLFYDEAKRKEFERNFIRHFYFREIGAETIERFKWYLEDKMQIVFPYYNELFKTTLIEYDKTYNYDMKETYTRNVENNSKQSGVSSTVGRTTDEQTSETDENRKVDTIGNAVVDKVNETEESEKVTTETSETVDNDTTSNNTVTEGKTTDNRFLDTPQGLTNLTDSKYLTELRQETQNGTTTNNGSGTSDTTTTGNGTTETDRNGKLTVTDITDTTGKETTEGKVTNVSNAEQIATQDNNTRHYAQGESKEEYTLTRVGNIGTQTASDMLEKHIELQKKLSKIEKMFFEECEDLFMLVY